MMQAESTKQEEIVSYLKDLRDEIIAGFEGFEKEKRFQRKEWHHHGGGGGEIADLRGDVFEKAAVNWSGVRGKELPFKEDNEPSFATGVSLISHMMNPFMPTVHMNVRYIETAHTSWFGGGYDLTPMGFETEEDTRHFHGVARAALGEELYQKFSKEAAEYFYIKHWKKERGGSV